MYMHIHACAHASHAMKLSRTLSRPSNSFDNMTCPQAESAARVVRLATVAHNRFRAHGTSAPYTSSLGSLGLRCIIHLSCKKMLSYSYDLHLQLQWFQSHPPIYCSLNLHMSAQEFWTLCCKEWQLAALPATIPTCAATYID